MASLRSIGKRKAWNSWAEKALSMASAMRGLKAAAVSLRAIGKRKAWNSLV